MAHRLETEMVVMNRMEEVVERVLEVADVNKVNVMIEYLQKLRQNYNWSGEDIS
jgi:hypothetical protein